MNLKKKELIIFKRKESGIGEELARIIMKKLNEISKKSKNNKRIVVITYTQDLDDARVIKEKIDDTHPELGTNYFLVKATSFLRELEKLNNRNPKKYEEVKLCSASWKKLGKHFD